MGVHIPQGKWAITAILGVDLAFKSIRNLRCKGRFKRDHSIANNVMQQKG